MSASSSPPSSGKSAAVREISTPDLSSAPWARYASPPIPGDFFHFITNWNASGSVTTACRGRWAASEASVATENPAHVERCEPCERFRIERVQVERGLAELVSNAPRVVLTRHWLAEDEEQRA